MSLISHEQGVPNTVASEWMIEFVSFSVCCLPELSILFLVHLNPFFLLLVYFIPLFPPAFTHKEELNIQGGSGICEQVHFLLHNHTPQ